MTVLVRTRPWTSSTHAWIRHAVSFLFPSFSFSFSLVPIPSFTRPFLSSSVSHLHPRRASLVSLFLLLTMLSLWWWFGCCCCAGSYVRLGASFPPRSTPSQEGDPSSQVAAHHPTMQDAGRERKGEGWEPIPASKSQWTVHNPFLCPLLSDRSIVVGWGRKRWDPLREMGNRDDGIHPRRGRGPTSKAKQNPRRTIVAHRLDAPATMQIFVKTRAYHDDRTRNTYGCNRRKKEEGRGRDVERRNDARKKKRKEEKNKRGEVAAWGRC